MYYPYLRARQFELIALRELAIEKQTQSFVIPILEPVKNTFNSLTLANQVFVENDQETYLVLNPLLGEVTEDNSLLLEYFNGLDNRSFRPAFHYRQNASIIRKQIKESDLQDCMLLCQNDISLNESGLRELFGMHQVKAITVADPDKNRTLRRFLANLGKHFIRLDDLFEKQSRNQDFLDIAAHRFSEEHLHFNSEGYNGFADYTVLPSEYIEGGSTPRAVVIHFTYLHENEIWIRHFTSDTNDSIANVQGKFAEAAEKAVKYCRLKGLKNSAINEMEDYFDQQHYPGLGTVKKLSIKNHLLVVSSYLRNK